MNSIDENQSNEIVIKVDSNNMINIMKIDVKNSLFPYCIVWTPLPIITWLIPIIGHMGIAYSNGVIRDFAGSYYVSEGNMAFGKPTKYWQLKPNKVKNTNWNDAILNASTVYSNRIHNLLIDNCHSHVAYALNQMQYNGFKRYNMILLFILICLNSKYVSFISFIKTWLPFCIILFIFIIFINYFY